MKPRNETVSVSDYRRIMKEIRRRAHAHGIKLRIYRRPIVWNGWGSGHPRLGVNGAYWPNKKLATVSVRGKSGRAEILFCALHELRHGIHHASGMFPEYYHEAGVRYYRFCKWVALLAEQDCNDYAHKELLELGVWHRPEMYPMKSYR